jgi:signal transduction histidine kinase
LSVWAAIFYYTVTDEINDETDDTLERYSEQIIIRTLAGEELPSKDNGTNNSYHLREVDEDYANSHPRLQYYDDDIYVSSIHETEPARILKTIFLNVEDKYFELIVTIPTFEKKELLEKVFWWTIILYVFLLLAIIICNTWILRRNLKPLYSLLDWLNKHTVGQQISPLNNDTSISEFRKLNEAIMHSARRNNEIYEQQREFIGNASHEIQTPLAICQNRLELLVEDSSLTNSQINEIHQIIRTIEYMSKLNKTLLLLTKIENRQFPEIVQIDVEALLKKLTVNYSEVYKYKNISLNWQLRHPVKVNMNETLGSILFNNLLKNAFGHSPDNGKIEIRLNTGYISIANTATNGALNPSYIFRRFYQGSKKEGVTGLGLSIVESICRIYGIGITYNFDSYTHYFILKISAGHLIPVDF